MTLLSVCADETLEIPIERICFPSANGAVWTLAGSQKTPFQPYCLSKQLSAVRTSHLVHLDKSSMLVQTAVLLRLACVSEVVHGSLGSQEAVCSESLRPRLV